MLNVILFFFILISGIFLTLVKNPAFAFATYEIVYFINPFNRWWGYSIPQFSYSFLTVALMLFAYLINFKNSNKNEVLATKTLTKVYLLVVLYGFATFNAAFPDENIQATVNMFKMAIIITIAYKLIDTRKKLDIALFTYIAGCFYISLIAFQTGRNASSRIENIGTVDAQDANGLANTLAPSLIFIAYYFWVSRSMKVKVFILFLGAFIANSLILINSRGSILGVAAGMSYFIYMLYFSQHKHTPKRLSILAFIMAGLIGSLSIVDTSFIDRMKSLSSNTEVTYEKETGSTRVLFWVAAAELSLDKPLGVGAYGFQAYSDEYLPADLHTGANRARAVHSTWMQALSEIGYPGLIIFISLLYTCFKICRKSRKQALNNESGDEYLFTIALESALITFLIAATFINRLRAEVLYWLILYITCYYNIIFLRGNQNPLIPNKNYE